MSEEAQEYRGTRIIVRFDGAKCIHSRHCVLDQPQVFRANVSGPWIAPDSGSVEGVVQVAHACPSGAITYERLEAENGIFWPCPGEGHPGTPRLFEPGSWNPVAKGAGPFYFPDGKARFNVAEYSPPAEVVDADYPVILTTGRVISQFLSGTQTRRIGPLVDQYPEPVVEMHPRLAARLGVRNGEPVRVVSRRGEMTLDALVVRTIRPDTVFIPYHWAEEQSANRLTLRALDPTSKIPEFKVCAVRVEKAPAPAGRPRPIPLRVISGEGATS